MLQIHFYPYHNYLCRVCSDFNCWVGGVCGCYSCAHAGAWLVSSGSFSKLNEGVANQTGTEIRCDVFFIVTHELTSIEANSWSEEPSTTKAQQRYGLYDGLMLVVLIGGNGRSWPVGLGNADMLLVGAR